MAQDNRDRVGRREFFKKALGAASVTALAVGGAARPVLAEEAEDELRKARYRETDHVRAYYRTNRYYTSEETEE
jgi:HPt (histidine-containing phosphotransfer) domain-containing protein